MKTLTLQSIINSGGTAMLYTDLDFHRSFTYVTTMNDKGIRSKPDKRRFFS